MATTFVVVRLDGGRAFPPSTDVFISFDTEHTRTRSSVVTSSADGTVSWLDEGVTVAFPKRTEDSKILIGFHDARIGHPTGAYGYAVQAVSSLSRQPQLITLTSKPNNAVLSLSMHLAAKPAGRTVYFRILHLNPIPATMPHPPYVKVQVEDAYCIVKPLMVVQDAAPPGGGPAAKHAVYLYDFECKVRNFPTAKVVVSLLAPAKKAPAGEGAAVEAHKREAGPVLGVGDIALAAVKGEGPSARPMLRSGAPFLLAVPFGNSKLHCVVCLDDYIFPHASSSVPTGAPAHGQVEQIFATHDGTSAAGVGRCLVRGMGRSDRPTAPAPRGKEPLPPVPELAASAPAAGAPAAAVASGGSLAPVGYQLEGGGQATAGGAAEEAGGGADAPAVVSSSFFSNTPASAVDGARGGGVAPPPNGPIAGRPPRETPEIHTALSRHIPSYNGPECYVPEDTMADARELVSILESSRRAPPGAHTPSRFDTHPPHDAPSVHLRDDNSRYLCVPLGREGDADALYDPAFGPRSLSPTDSLLLECAEVHREASRTPRRGRSNIITSPRLQAAAARLLSSTSRSPSPPKRFGRGSGRDPPLGLRDDDDGDVRSGLGSVGGRSDGARRWRDGGVALQTPPAMLSQDDVREAACFLSELSERVGGAAESVLAAQRGGYDRLRELDEREAAIAARERELTSLQRGLAAAAGGGSSPMSPFTNQERGVRTCIHPSSAFLFSNLGQTHERSRAGVLEWTCGDCRGIYVARDVALCTQCASRCFLHAGSGARAGVIATPTDARAAVAEGVTALCEACLELRSRREKLAGGGDRLRRVTPPHAYTNQRSFPTSAGMQPVVTGGSTLDAASGGRLTPALAAAARATRAAGSDYGRSPEPVYSSPGGVASPPPLVQASPGGALSPGMGGGYEFGSPVGLLGAEGGGRGVGGVESPSGGMPLVAAAHLAKAERAMAAAQALESVM